ncbi:MAG TPA: DUF4386 family protein [Marmoricola sp.]|jgi:hypothetical protein|nr:DUF4386 family protein [Marmoricola sp.]
MTQLLQPRPATADTDWPGSRTAWRWAGGLGLAHVLLLLGAFSIEGVGADSATFSTATKVYGAFSPDRVRYGSFVEAMSFVLLVPALVLLARLLGRKETGRVAGQTMVGLGVAYVGATLAIGFPPLNVAVSAAHHGADPALVASLDLLRNDGFILQVGLLFAVTLALGVAALSERRLTRWAGWGGIGVGALGLVATPFAHDGANLVWMAWWVGLCVLCLRGGPREPADHAPID